MPAFAAKCICSFWQKKKKREYENGLVFHQQCSSPPLCWSYGGFLCPLCACMHACKRGERGRDHMLGLSVQAAWSHSLWSAGVTVIRLWLFASLLINHGPLLYSTVRLYSILNCELINSSNCRNQRSFACILQPCLSSDGAHRKGPDVLGYCNATR